MSIYPLLIKNNILQLPEVIKHVVEVEDENKRLRKQLDKLKSVK